MYTHIAYLSTEQNARPSGVRIVEPPSDTRQAMRGNLYAVIEHGGNDPTQAQLVEHALSVIQRTYYTIKGTQTFVLTEALREGMLLFPSATDAKDAPNAPGILLMAHLGDKVMAVGMGPAVALLTSGHKVDVYPPYVTGANSARPSHESHNTLEFYRHDIPQGGTVMLAGQRCLQHFTLRELASIVAYVTEENVADVTAALRSQAGINALTGLIAVIRPEEEGHEPPSRATGGAFQRKRRTSLPGALSAQLGARTLEPESQPVHGAQATGLSTTTEYPKSNDPSAVADTSNGMGEQVTMSSPETHYPVQTTAAPFPATAGLFDMAQRIITQARTFFDGILPERSDGKQHAAEYEQLLPPPVRSAATPVTESATETQIAQSSFTEEPPIGLHDYAAENDSPEDLEADELPYALPIGSAETDAYPSTQDHRPNLTHETDPMTPLRAANQTSTTTTPHMARTPAHIVMPKRAMGRRARLFMLVALLILLLTVVIVATVFWTAGRSNSVAAEELLAQAESSYVSAENALAVGDKATAGLKLIDAQAFIAKANDVVGTRMERADQLSERVEQQLAELLQIQPLHALAVPLVRFPEAAQPQRVVVSDQDIYVLDTGRRSVHFFELDPTRNVVTDLDGEIILSEGDVIDGITVGRLVDITWLPAIAGVQDKAYLLVLDGNNHLFRYDRRVEGVSFVELGGRDQLRSPAQMRVYADRLYVADAGANQIFRYGRGNFTEPPEAWFSDQTQSNLSSLRSMAIDGSIWILLNEGLLSRFNAGTQAQFSPETSFGEIKGPVDLAVGNDSTSSIYVADSQGERILVFSKDGKYLRQLRAPEGDALHNLRGISVDEIGGVIYILTQSSLFHHPLID